jgi:hypothetical protein
MPEARFELTVTVFERAKAVHALDCSATVTGILGTWSFKTNYFVSKSK